LLLRNELSKRLLRPAQAVQSTRVAVVKGCILRLFRKANCCLKVRERLCRLTLFCDCASKIGFDIRVVRIEPGCLFQLDNRISGLT